MSIYTQKALDNGVVTGFASDFGPAWHQARLNVQQLKDLGRLYDGPVPTDVAETMIGWTPVVIEPGIIGTVQYGDDGTPELTTFDLPDRLSKFIANPNTGRIVNIAGSGYNSDLHITMREAIQAAMDAEADIASVVCLGDGAHMGMSFRARDGVILGGEWGGAIPLVGFNSSLTGAIATQLDTSTTLRVCDNTMRMAAATAKRSLKVKRTRFSANKVTASAVREALEISFQETEDLVAELERLANIDVNMKQLAQVLNTWKPIPDEDGRAKTIAENTQMAFIQEFNGTRNPFGLTVAGLWQAHNTWAHWEQTMRGMDGATARLDRKAMRTAEGDVEDMDRKFMEIIAGVFDDVLVEA